MAFTVPNFNLPVNIWHTTVVPPGPPAVQTHGNLSYSRRVVLHTSEFGEDEDALNFGMYLLLPAATDIRSSICGDGPGMVEVPAGSGRFYIVWSVDDAGKGFSNEHRVAFIGQVGPWPKPIP